MRTVRGKLLVAALAVAFGAAVFTVWVRTSPDSRSLQTSTGNSIAALGVAGDSSSVPGVTSIVPGSAVQMSGEAETRRNVGADTDGDGSRDTWRLVLRIVDADDGSPLASASAFVRPLDGSLTTNPTELHVSADGEMSLVGFVGTTLHVRASAPGHDSKSRSVAETDVDPLIRLPRYRGSVQGVVRASGTAVTDVDVRVVDDAGREWGSTRTDSTGRFAIGSLPTQHPHLAICAAADGWSPVTLALPPLVAGSIHDALLELEPGRSVRVRCETFDSTPIAGAVVRLDGDLQVRGHFVTDGRGEVTLANASRRAFRLIGTADGWVAQTADVAACGADEPAGGDSEVVLRFMPAPMVTGRIAAEQTDMAFDPARTTVRFARADGLRSDFALSGVDFESIACGVAVDGSFSCRQLIPGVRYRCVAECSGFAPCVGDRDVVLASGERLDVGTLVLRRGRSLDGRVTDFSGAPVARASIFTTAALADSAHVMRGCVAASDGDGRFVLTHLPDEPVVVSAESDDRLAQAVVSASTPSVDLVLKPRTTWALTGTCVDELGVPLEGVELLVWELPASAWAAKTKVRSDANGVFHLGSLHGFECGVDVTQDAPYVIQDTPVTVHVGDPPLTVVLRASRRLVGRVVRADGGLARGATAVWTPPAGAGSARSVGVDPDSGEFSLRVPVDVAGSLCVEEVGGGRIRRAIPADRRDGELGQMVLPSVVEHTVRCRSASGTPLAGLRIVCRPANVSGSDADSVESTTDASGSARVVLDIACAWVLTTRWADSTHTRSLPQWSSAGAPIDFDGLADPVWLKLHVRSKSGKHVDGQRVLLAGVDELRESRLDQDGRADFVDVPPGRYEVRLWLFGPEHSVGASSEAGAPVTQAFQVPHDRKVHDLEVEID